MPLNLWGAVSILNLRHFLHWELSDVTETRLHLEGLCTGFGRICVDFNLYTWGAGMGRHCCLESCQEHYTGFSWWEAKSHHSDNQGKIAYLRTLSKVFITKSKTESISMKANLSYTEADMTSRSWLFLEVWCELQYIHRYDSQLKVCLGIWWTCLSFLFLGWFVTHFHRWLVTGLWAACWCVCGSTSHTFWSSCNHRRR